MASEKIKQKVNKESSYDAKDITVKDSLMPLNKKFSEKKEQITIVGYEMIYDPCLHNWIFTHILSDQWNLNNAVYVCDDFKCYRHHFDFNKLNNNPTNLVRVSRENHLKIHREQISKTLHRTDVKEKCRLLRRKDDFRRMMSERMKVPETSKKLSANAKRQWSDHKYK